MNFLQRLRYGIQRMMVGRNGVDKLSMTMIWIGIGLYFIAAFVSSSVLNLIALLVYGVAFFRIFSKKTYKRAAENRKFLHLTAGVRRSITQRRNRWKHRKEFRYFKCPNCKAWLKVPRGAGHVKVKCGKCENQFSYVAK